MLGNNKKIQATGAINYGQSSGIPLRALVYSIYQSSGSLYVEGFQENLTITVPIQDTISFTDTVITLN